jgi:hypothetical protein
MNIETHPSLTFGQTRSVLKLWNEEYPKQLNYKSVDELNGYLSGLAHVVHYLIINDDEDVLGWASKFSRDAQKWFVIIINSNIHGKGWGSKILQMIIAHEEEINGWVVDNDSYTKSDSSVYRSPLAFYQKTALFHFQIFGLKHKTCLLSESYIKRNKDRYTQQVTDLRFPIK